MFYNIEEDQQIIIKLDKIVQQKREGRYKEFKRNRE